MPRNIHAASKTGGQTESNAEIIKLMTFIEQTIQTVPVYNEKFKNMFEYSSDPFGNILNLSKHSFSLNTYKLLNKNLNFVSTPKQYSQKQLDTDNKNFSVPTLKLCQ